MNALIGAVPVLALTLASEVTRWVKRRREARRLEARARRALAKPGPAASGGRKRRPGVEAGTERTEFWSLEQRRDG